MERKFDDSKKLADIILEAREDFKKRYGRLLTEEEAIRLTDEIRGALRKEGKLDEY